MQIEIVVSVLPGISKVVLSFVFVHDFQLAKFHPIMPLPKLDSLDGLALFSTL